MTQIMTKKSVWITFCDQRKRLAPLFNLEYYFLRLQLGTIQLKIHISANCAQYGEIHFRNVGVFFPSLSLASYDKLY